MTTLTPTHPIYQKGPLAQAITAFRQQQEQAHIKFDKEEGIRAERIKTYKNNLLTIVKERFGEFWSLFEPHIVTTDCDDEYSIDIGIALPEVAPFWIRQSKNGLTKINFTYTHIQNFDFPAGQPIDSKMIACAILEGHEWWLTKEAQNRAAADKKAKLLAYAEAWRDYERERINILAKNEMALALLQEEYTTTFPVWWLTYGVTAYNDELGEFYADTRGVWVLSPDPDEDGFFPVIDDTGQVNHRKYYSLVYLEGPETFHAAPGSTYCGHIHIKEADDTLYFSPLLKYAEVLTRARGWVEANMHPLPEPPHYGDFGLDEQPDRYEMEDLQRELTCEGDEEIPF